MGIFKREPLFDTLSPEEQQRVVANASKRVGSSRATDYNAIANMLRAEDKAAANAMQYAGVGKVPEHLYDEGDDPSSVVNIHSLIDRYADETDAAQDSPPLARAASTSNNARAQVNTKGDPVKGMPKAAPNEKTNKSADLNSSDEASNSELLGTLGIVGGGLLTAVAAKALYNKWQQGKATPEEEMLLLQDLTMKEEAAKTNGATPTVNNDARAGNELPAPQQRQQIESATQNAPRLTGPDVIAAEGPQAQKALPNYSNRQGVPDSIKDELSARYEQYLRQNQSGQRLAQESEAPNNILQRFLATKHQMPNIKVKP